MKTLKSVVLLACMAAPVVAAAQRPARLAPTVVVDTAINAVTVQNDRDRAVVIYLEAGNVDRRLGTVSAHETKLLPLPSWAVNGRVSARFFAHPEDTPAPLVTPIVRLRPPGRIGMRIPSFAAFASPTASAAMTEAIAPDDQDHATLTVDNPRDVPCAVFAETGVFSVKLGVAQPGERLTLRLPNSVVGPFSPVLFFVRPQGGFDFRSHLLTIREGQHLGLRIPAM